VESSFSFIEKGPNGECPDDITSIIPHINKAYFQDYSGIIDVLIYTSVINYLDVD
jgi:hypothetical protein